MPKVTLYGFDGSTYVRTVKMLFAEKGFRAFEQVPVNVLKGEPHSPEHLARHPFGKVPVLEWDGLSILETSAITRFLNDKLPGKSLVPSTPEDRARMDMTIGLIDSYGYGALLEYVMKLRGDSPFIAGELSLADLYLAPVLAYVSMTPDKDAVLSVPQVSAWWEKVSALDSYKNTAPG